MSDMTVNSTSARVSMAYAGYMTKFEPEKRKPEVSKQNGLYTLQELELTAVGVRKSLSLKAWPPRVDKPMAMGI